MDIVDDDIFYDVDGDLMDIADMINPERTYNLRVRIDHFNYWNDTEFFNRFRLSKPTVTLIFNQIEEFLQNRTERNLDRAISPLEKLLLTLRFLASGDFYITLGDFSGIHKTTAGKTIKQGITAICNLFQQVVRLPQTEEEQQDAKRDFFSISRFPRVVGAIDCTHVKVISHGGENAEIYRNRKGYFSLNCQVVGSAKLKIIDLVARWLGSAHDSNIFENSAVNMRLLNGEMRNGVFLGDQGYRLQPYILTPLGEPENEAERLYNEAQIRTRNVIERLFGIWKRRFPILSAGIRCNMELTQMIIAACAVLHNIAIDENEENFINEQEFDEKEEQNIPRDRREGINARMPFIDYFRNLLEQRNRR